MIQTTMIPQGIVQRSMLLYICGRGLDGSEPCYVFSLGARGVDGHYDLKHTLADIFTHAEVIHYDD